MESQVRPVVVGFDGSPDARLAVSWAVAETRTRELPLRLVVARGDLYRLSAWADDWTRGLAEEWLDDARKLLAETGGGDAELVVRDGVAPAVLVAESARADCLVVGSRGHGAVLGAWQGSVSQQVTRHAAGPVVVVRRATDEHSRSVVVGVDGSTGSMEALEFALRHADAHGHSLAVLHVRDWWRGGVVRPPARAVPEMVAEFEADDTAVLREVRRTVARYPGVDVRLRDAQSHPARALVRASRSAALVVVGSRGRSAFAGMVLGSVSAEVLRHASCPVAVVR